MYSNSTLSLLRHVFGQQLLRKRTIASGGSHASVGKSLRKRQKSPQVGSDRETCGNHRQVAPEPGPRRGTRAGVEMRFSTAVSRVSGAVVLAGFLRCDNVELAVEDGFSQLLFGEQPVDLGQELLLLFLVKLTGGLACVTRVGRTDAAVLAEHERGRERVEVHGLRQPCRRLLGFSGDQKRIRDVVLLDETTHAREIVQLRRLLER